MKQIYGIEVIYNGADMTKPQQVVFFITIYIFNQIFHLFVGFDDNKYLDPRDGRVNRKEIWQIGYSHQ